MTKIKNNSYETQSIKKSNTNTRISKYLSIIILNVNGLNCAIKRLRFSDWIKNQHPTICCLQETHHNQRHMQTKSERLQKDILGMEKLKASSSNYSHIRQSRF
jgi:exonuclease III